MNTVKNLPSPIVLGLPVRTLVVPKKLKEKTWKTYITKVGTIIAVPTFVEYEVKKIQRKTRLSYQQALEYFVKQRLAASIPYYESAES